MGRWYRYNFGLNSVHAQSGSLCERPLMGTMGIEVHHKPHLGLSEGPVLL